MSIEIDNPKAYAFFIVKFKPTFEENELQFFYDNNEIQLKEYECEKVENYKIKIIFFQKISSSRKFYIKYKSIKQNLDNSINFFFNTPILSYSQLELSDSEEFRLYHNFVNEIKSDSLIELFYTNATLNFGKKKINLYIALELLTHYKNDEKYIEVIYSMITITNKYSIDMYQLNKSKEKWIQFVEVFDKIELLSEDQVNKGKIILMIFLYICLDYDKFNKFYEKNKNDKKKKEEMYRIIGLNKTIEHLFIVEKVIKDFSNHKSFEKIKDMLSKINYFENYLFLLDYILKNTNKKINQIEIKDNYHISKDDDIDKIINIYEDLIKVIPNFKKEKKIKNFWISYINEFEKDKNIKKLIELKIIIPESELLKNSISKCVQTILDSLDFSNMEMIDFIKKNLTSNIHLLRGELEFMNIFSKFDFEKIEENFIKEFKNMKLRELMGSRAFYSTQAIPIINANNLNQLEKIMEILDFGYDPNVSNELFFFQNFLTSINETIERFLNDYKDIEYDSLVNIVIKLSSNRMNTESLKKLIEILYNKLPKKVQIKLFIQLINIENIFNNEIYEKIINYLRILCIENNQIEETLENIQNINYLNSILENYELPKEDDFFLNEEKKSLKIIKTFIDKRVFENSNFIKDGYGNKILLLINELKTKIIQKQIQLKLGEEMLRLDHDININNDNAKQNILELRLKLIFFDKNEINNIKNIKTELINSIIKAKEIKSDVDKIYSYLKEFFDRDPRIRKYSILKTELIKATINEYELLIQKAKTYDTLKKISNIIFEFKQSKIFQKIFYFTKEKLRNDDALSESILVYNQFYEIINDEQRLSDPKNEELLELISTSYHNFDELNNCIQYIIE